MRVWRSSVVPMPSGIRPVGGRYRPTADTARAISVDSPSSSNPASSPQLRKIGTPKVPLS
jgi:hypothetical protein